MKPLHPTLLIPAVPLLWALFVFFSALTFTPVPWPDDSAFYFVAKEFFAWPPRWVMLPQAPFEPTYAIHNFNTMPLYPILIGLGRWVGIDGAHALKLWPLGFWALGGSLLTWSLMKKGLPWAAALAVSLAFALDPTLRWASTLVRPESLVGLCGVALVLGLTFGWPKRIAPGRGLWDPSALLLALAAYAHFNAIHLVPIVVVAHVREPRKVLRVGALTALYLVPWLTSVLLMPGLFFQQMTTQWKRLAIHNGWLESLGRSLSEMFHEMGSPENLPELVRWAGLWIWALVLMAIAVVAAHLFHQARKPRRKPKPGPGHEAVRLAAPAATWLLAAVWLWHTKPEVWFIYFMHAAAWTFAGIGALALLRLKRMPRAAWATLVAATLLPPVALFAHGTREQHRLLGQGDTWSWARYESLIDCVDRQLTRLERDLGSPKPFRVWAPTYPDILIELSLRHPHWELTRTNDFWERRHLAVAHGHDVEAVVVPETIQREERELDAPASKHPDVLSAWMTWKDYFLHDLWKDPEWKPSRRWICQRGRWQAFLFMKEPGSAPTRR